MKYIVTFIIKSNVLTGVSDFSAGVRTTFIYVIVWVKRPVNTLQDVYYSTDFNMK
jgi:hypothetical protein